MFWIKNLSGRGFNLTNLTDGGDYVPSGFGRGKKGWKERPLTKILKNLARTKNDFIAMGIDTTNVEKHEKSIRENISRLDKILGKKLSREYLNYRLSQKEDERRERSL